MPGACGACAAVQGHLTAAKSCSCIMEMVSTAAAVNVANYVLFNDVSSGTAGAPWAAWTWAPMPRLALAKQPCARPRCTPSWPAVRRGTQIMSTLGQVGAFPTWRNGGFPRR